MKQLISLVTAALLLSVVWPESNALAQTPNDRFRGSSWRLISGRFEQHGRPVLLTAPRLQGFLMFDGNDHFLIVITRSALSKPAPNSGQRGKAKGNIATLPTSIASFGTYSTNEADRTINVHIESSTFPKWIGTDQKRLFVASTDKLRLTDPSRSGGAGAVESVWQRVK